MAINCSKFKAKGALQFNLFEEPERSLQNEILDKVIDNIRSRYGVTAILRASGLMRGGTAIRRSRLVGGHKR